MLEIIDEDAEGAPEGRRIGVESRVALPTHIPAHEVTP